MQNLMRRYSQGAGALKTETPLVEEVVEAAGLPLHRRLGRAVKVPDEELAFVTEEALTEILTPEALNSGNVVDIFQNREEDFLATSTLEVTYNDEKGQKVVETLFVDTLYPQNYPRVCVSAHAVQAMHRAIAVLTRKVDNLSMTLKTCREHYYKELFFLRHGRPPEEDHEVYWFNPKAYEDSVTKKIMRDRLNGREKELQEALDEKHKELEKYRLALESDDAMSHFRKYVSNMPLSQLFKLLTIHNSARQEQFYVHLQLALDEWRNKTEDGTDAPPSPGAAKGAELMERLEATEGKVKTLQDHIRASNVRNTMLCRQIRGLGGVPGLVEFEDHAAEDEEAAARKRQEEEELEALRREERLKIIEENEQARREGRDGLAAETMELRQQVVDERHKARAWEEDAKRVMERLQRMQKDLDEKNRELKVANKTIEKLWFNDNKAGNAGGRLRKTRTLRLPGSSGEDNSPSPRTSSKSLLNTPSQEDRFFTSQANRRSTRTTKGRAAAARRRLLEEVEEDTPTDIPEEVSQSDVAPHLSGLLESEQGQERCTCGALMSCDHVYCTRCGASRQDLQATRHLQLPRRRPQSAPAERSRQYNVIGRPNGRRDDWWKEVQSRSPSKRQASKAASAKGSKGPPSVPDGQPSDQASVRSLHSSLHDFDVEAESLGPSERSSLAVAKVDCACQTDEHILRELARARRMSTTWQDFGEYLVFNSDSRAVTPGLLYCAQKAKGSQRDILATWGTTVLGVDEGDGWVRVGDHFLPKNVNGKPVLIRQTGDEYRVCGDDEVPGRGLAFQASKELGRDRSGDIAKWGTAVVGADEGDGWVRVGNRYLPKELAGTPVLEMKATGAYLVFDGHPQLEAHGLPSCLRKRLDTATNELVPWGTLVNGTDEGDGWVKVGEHYLPKEIEGATVLVMQAAEDFVVCSRPSSTRAKGIPLCVDKRLDSWCGCLDWGSEVRAVDQRDGWVRVGELHAPIILNGVTVLQRKAEGNFVVKNVFSNSEVDGIPYCARKDLDSKIGISAEGGSVVGGVDEGDGWVKVGDFFLSKEMDGMTVLTREEKNDYIVSSGHPEVETSGLPYCMEKELHPRYGKVAQWRGSIRGTDEGDGWVKVGNSYLPQQVEGKKVLTIQEREDFVICDGHPAFESEGLPYCVKRDLSTGCGILGRWGSLVEGVDEGDGWIRCGEYYLPKVVDGVPVMKPQAETVYQICDGHPNVSAKGLPYYLQKRESGKSFVRLAPWNSVVVGWDEGDGWVKVGSRYLPKEVDGVPVLLQRNQTPIPQAPTPRVAPCDPELEPEPEAPGCERHPSNGRWSSSQGPDYGTDDSDSWVGGGMDSPSLGPRRPSPVAEDQLGEVADGRLGEVYSSSDGRGDNASPIQMAAAGSQPHSRSSYAGSPGALASPSPAGSRPSEASPHPVGGRGSAPSPSFAGSPSPVPEYERQRRSMISASPASEEFAQAAAAALPWPSAPRTSAPSRPATRAGSRRGSHETTGRKSRSPSPDHGPPGPLLDIPQPSAPSQPAGVASKPPLQRERMKFGKVPPPVALQSRSVTPVTRTPTPATWLPPAEEHRTGSSATSSRPVSMAGQRVRTMNAETQTLVGFSMPLPGWSLAAPHPSMKKVDAEAYHLAVWMRHSLLLWCFNFIRTLDPTLLSDEMVNLAMSSVEEGCEALSKSSPGEQPSRNVAGLRHIVKFNAAKKSELNLILKSPPSPRSTSKGSAGSSRPPSARLRKAATYGADLLTVVATGKQSKFHQSSQESSDDDRAVPVNKLREFTFPFGKDQSTQTEGSLDSMPSLDGVPSLRDARGRKSLAAGRKSLALGRFSVFGGAVCPACGRSGSENMSQRISRVAKTMQFQGEDSDSDDEPAKPAVQNQGLKAKPEGDRPRPRSIKFKKKDTSDELEDESSESPKSKASSGIFAEAEARDYTDAEEIQGADETIYSPLKLSDLVNTGWPGFFSKGGGSFITATSPRTNKLRGGRWRHKVAAGGVSFRDPDTIVAGRRRPVVVTPPLEGADKVDIDISATRAPGMSSKEAPTATQQKPLKSALRKRLIAPSEGRPGTR